jgi:hypothetical protein
MTWHRYPAGLVQSDFQKKGRFLSLLVTYLSFDYHSSPHIELTYTTYTHKHLKWSTGSGAIWLLENSIFETLVFDLEKGSLLACWELHPYHTSNELWSPPILWPSHDGVWTYPWCCRTDRSKEKSDLFGWEGPFWLALAQFTARFWVTDKFLVDTFVLLYLCFHTHKTGCS